MDKTLYLIRGLPGSGKSTLASLILAGSFSEKNVALEADDYFTDAYGSYNFDRSKLKEAHAQCHAGVEDAMKRGHDTIVVSNTFVRQWEMNWYKNKAREYGYTVNEIVMRNSFGSIHGVPNEDMLRMADAWED